MTADWGGELPALNGHQWRELEECANRLEKTLQDGPAPVDLSQFLPSRGAPHRLAVLYELIKIELEARFLHGQRSLLEEYLVRYPELGGPDKLPPSLLVEEHHVRRRFGDRPHLDEYRDRFPRQFERLRALVQPTDDCAGEPLVLQELVGYQKLELLGSGKFGEVWKALAPGGVEVALKIIVRKIDRELRALEEIKRLRHSHLLQTHSFGMLEGNLTIVMELADMSLSERYQQCVEQGLPGIPTDWLVNYFKQAAAAIDYLRREQVSHCDIKPQNLLIQQGLAKVADFGLARAQEQRLKLVSSVVGTPYYMAPEMWKQQISIHSDQYSLAATYVHLRLGRPLFQGDFFEVMEQHVCSDPKLDPLPPAEQAVLRIALAKEPDHRFPNCMVFAEALEEATKPQAPPPLATPAPSAHVGLILALASVVFTLLATFVVFRLLPGPQMADWQPEGWQPANAKEFAVDRDGRRFYRRLVRDVGGQKVVMVAVPRQAVNDPPTFYIMENKVWNDLYAVFFPKSKELFEKYRSRPGCQALLSNEPSWALGALADDLNPDPDSPPFLGVNGAQAPLPVFRVTPTEAHCFAEWLGGPRGRLPSRKQWLKAAGKDDDAREGPFPSRIGLAIGLNNQGPWPVDGPDRDISVHGCRQMASNGVEWTRDLQDGASIPLDRMERLRSVFVLGQSYRSAEPLRFVDMDNGQATDCTRRHIDVTFRIVLEE